MTDRELLEMAAKAGKIDLWWDEHGNAWLGGNLRVWNPLTNDGDALRLAVTLGLEYVIDRAPGTATMSRNGDVVRVRVWGNGKWHKEEVGPSVSADLLGAARRAITRAAADIGRGMG